MASKLYTLSELVADFPRLTHRDVAAEVLAAAGATIVADELGRPCVSAADAKAWLESERAAITADDARQDRFQEHLAAGRAWEASRLASAHGAAKMAREKHRSPTSGEAHGAGQQAAQEAAEEFERTVARPVFEGKTGVALHHLSEDEAASGAGSNAALRRRITAKLASSVAR